MRPREKNAKFAGYVSICSHVPICLGYGIVLTYELLHKASNF